MTSKQDQDRALKIVGVILLVLLGILYAFRIPLSVIGINTFLFIDNLVEFSRNIHPVILWGILGLFVGLLYGTFTAWKKYRLEFKLNLIPLGVFVLFITLLILVNKPFESKASLNEDNKETNQLHRITHYYYKIVSSKSFIHAEPSTKSTILSKAGSKGIEVEVLDFTNDQWWKVTLYNTVGYIKRGSLKFSRTDTTMQTSALEIPPANPPALTSVTDTAIVNTPVDSSAMIENYWSRFWSDFKQAVSNKDKNKIIELASNSFSNNASTDYNINTWLEIFDNEEGYNNLVAKINRGISGRSRGKQKYLGDEAGDEYFDYENGRWSFSGVLGD